MVGGLIAANSSTILTHLNWGASYLVHDFYRRFINRDAAEKHYVWVGRWATLGLFLCTAALTFALDTAKDAFDIILQIGAGTGLLYLLRWFWWRINAWCEVVAMLSSFGISLVFLGLKNYGVTISTHRALLITIAGTTFCWVLAAFFGPATDRDDHRTNPMFTGRVRLEAGVTDAEAKATHENIPLALLGWVSGCAVVWSGLFTVGNLLYRRWALALILFTVFVAAGCVLILVISRLWSKDNVEPPTDVRLPSPESANRK